MEVNIQIERRAKALDEGDRPGPGGRMSQARLLDQMRGDDAVNDAQHLTHDLGPVMLVTTNIPIPGDHPGRCVGHDPVFAKLCFYTVYRLNARS